jgi:site-specific recombinase XerD
MPRNVTASDEDFEKVLEEADARLRILMLCCRDAGLRISAALSLSPQSLVQRHDGTFVVEGRAKRGSSFEVPVTDRLRLELEYARTRAKPGQTLVEALSSRGQKPSRNYVGKLLRDAKKRAGVSARWTLHDLRRTAARRVYKVTGDIRKAQRFLGHVSTNATLWYLQDPLVTLSKDDVEKASSKRGE